MAITNRALDASEQRRAFQSSFAATATGATLLALHVPFNSTLEAVKLCAQGLSGSPTYDLRVWRFIVGTGVTTIAGGATTSTPLTMGTSGPHSMALAASGSSFLNLLANDVITLTSGATNAAVTGLSVAIVIKAIQDIKTVHGA
jgi:hypothetical protein